MKDIYQQMTDLILAQVDEAGAWKPCWHGTAGGGMPMNHTTGKRYRGMNILSCWISDMSNGYPTSRYASFKQWEAKGARVRKGEKGTPIIYYTVAAKKNAPDETYRMMKGSYVFNIAQVDGAEGLEPETFDPIDEATRIARIEHWILERSETIEIRHEENSAYYRPLTDSINMPVFTQFIDAEHYYSVLFHEMTHWTGHKSRLDRLAKYHDQTERAKEELIAELGSAFLAGEFGIHTHTRDDHVSYVASWLKALKNDKRAIVTAASQASAAVDYLQAIEPMRLAA